MGMDADNDRVETVPPSLRSGKAFARGVLQTLGIGLLLVAFLTVLRWLAHAGWTEWVQFALPLFGLGIGVVAATRGWRSYPTWFFLLWATLGNVLAVTWAADTLHNFLPMPLLVITPVFTGVCLYLIDKGTRERPRPDLMQARLGNEAFRSE